MKSKLKILSYVLGMLLAVSVFKNISYPLMWGDEGMTAMGSERIVKYGYPKAHDGKNVLNDMLCKTPSVAINAEDDAFMGGDNWGQYYFGVVGYLLANKADDIYAKTGLYRSTFAFMGLLGIFLLAIVVSGFFQDKFYKYLFITLFLLSELISVSLVLHLREVRYYPIALFFSSSVICLYGSYRFQRPFNKVLYSIVLAALLIIVFNLFSPLYFVFILTIGIFDAVLGATQYTQSKKLREAVMPCLPTFIAIFISCIAVFPLLIYFKTFEIKKIWDDYFHFGFAKYEMHFLFELGYFGRFELLWLALAMRAVILLNFNKALKNNSNLLRFSNFLSLLFIVSLFAIPDISEPFYTRYCIYMQPVLSITAIVDFILLLKIFANQPEMVWNAKVSILTAAFTLLFGFTFVRNRTNIKGYIYEMTHQYKGPLDYAIPYIKSHYQHPDTLIIATNCDEATYMYYLNSKVIVGYVGNNLSEDTLLQPDIICYRQSVGTLFPQIFPEFFRKTLFRKILFPGRDIKANNIPELNSTMSDFKHYFISPTSDNEKEQVSLFIKS
jgi:hypothetical protein